MKKIISFLFIILVLGGSFLLLQKSTPEKVLEKEPINVEINSNTNSKTKIIAIGDSLTAGYGLNLDESYPAQLEKKLLDNFYSIEVINSGISGETSAGLLERVDFIISQNPEVVLITIGGNDALRNLPIENTEKNILQIIKKLKLKAKPQNIFLLQIQAPGNLGVNYVNRFNNMYKNISQKEGVVLVKFVENEVFTNSELMQSDGTHPNKKGYELLVNKYIYPIIVKVLEK
jgi:acyl-CoA thioesterase-1